jgi:hypothetical protein
MICLQDENIRLSPARAFSLEDIVTYIGEDEMIDVSPSKIRIRCVPTTAPALLDASLSDCVRVSLSVYSKRELSSNARRRPKK